MEFLWTWQMRPLLSECFRGMFISTVPKHKILTLSYICLHIYGKKHKREKAIQEHKNRDVFCGWEFANNWFNLRRFFFAIIVWKWFPSHQKFLTEKIEIGVVLTGTFLCCFGSLRYSSSDLPCYGQRWLKPLLRNCEKVFQHLLMQ